MKNALLLCMSNINLGNVKEREYCYYVNENTNKKEEKRVKGSFTNEAPVKYVIDYLHEQREGKLDRIVAICSDEVKNEIELKTSSTEKVKDSELPKNQEDRVYFVEKVKKLYGTEKSKITTIGYYEKVVNEFAGHYEEYREDGKSTNIEIKDVSIPDMTQADQIASSVIEAANYVTEFEDEDIHLYIDFNGGQRYIAFMLVSIAEFMKVRNVKLEQVVSMNLNNGRIRKEGATHIQNLTSVFDNIDMVTSINEYINYGRIRGLKEYFGKSGDTRIDGLINEMEEFANNLQLCRTNAIIENAAILSRKFKAFVCETKAIGKSQEGNTYTQLFRYVIEDIQREFQPLLNKDIAEIIGWCVEKQYIQQALTFCSECLPQYLWDTGIYKANDKEYEEVVKVVNDVRDKKNGRENPTEELAKAVAEKQKYFDRKIIPDKYAYKWFVKYLPFCLKDDDYIIILSEVKNVRDVVGKYKTDTTKMLEQIQKKHYLKSYMKKTSSSRYKKANENASKNTAKLMWHYENGRIQSKITKQNKEELEEIIYTYFFMKGQRNAANHADGKKDGFEYSDICEILEHLAEKLKNINKN